MPLTGHDKHIKRLKSLRHRAKLNNMANAVVYQGADMIRARAHRLISQGSVSGKNHVPSAPGEAPNRDTGNLQAHIEATNPKNLVAQVTSSADYAAALEFGTSKMAARPYMKPARDIEKPKIERLFKKGVTELVRWSATVK